jgi:4-amino-4-deoxy-L-arabinose transferase-like glycosyltransferase
VQALLYGLGLPVLLAGRLLAAGAGILTVALVYALGRRLFSSAAGLAAALCYAVAPFAVLHDRLSLVDAPLTLAMTLAAYASVRAAQEAAWRWAALAALAGLSAVGIKSSGVVTAAFPLLAALLLGRRRATALAQQAVAAALTMGLYAVMLFGPLGPRFRYMATLHAIDLHRPLPLVAAVWLENATALGDWLLGYFPGIWVGLLLAALLLPLVLRSRAGWYLLGCCSAVVLPVVFYGRGADAIYARYVLPGLPFVAVLWGHLITRLAARLHLLGRRLPARLAAAGIWIGAPARRGALAAALLVIVLPLAWSSALVVAAPQRAPILAFDYWQYLSGYPAGWGLAQATDALERDAAGRLVFVLTTPRRGVVRDFVYLRFLDHPTIKPYVEWDIRRGVRWSLERWYSHGVPIYLVASSGIEEPAAIERNWPDATIIARVPKPGTASEIVVYRLPDPYS